jgi:endonuclease YncB( thermonuclease family)
MRAKHRSASGKQYEAKALLIGAPLPRPGVPQPSFALEMRRDEDAFRVFARSNAPAATRPQMARGIVALALVVVGVSDGDTLTVRDDKVGTTLRLAEIDAPKRTQAYSQVSRRNLADIRCIIQPQQREM